VGVASRLRLPVFDARRRSVGKETTTTAAPRSHFPSITLWRRRFIGDLLFVFLPFGVAVGALGGLFNATFKKVVGVVEGEGRWLGWLRKRVGSLFEGWVVGLMVCLRE
jgi:hypothetical protein